MPTRTVPLKNATAPVGVAVPGACVTVALIVTAVPKVAWLGEAVTVVVVPIWVIVIGAAAREPEGSKSVAPTYCAVIQAVPTGRCGIKRL